MFSVGLRNYPDDSNCAVNDTVAALTTWSRSELQQLTSTDIEPALVCVSPFVRLLVSSFYQRSLRRMANALGYRQPFQALLVC